MGVYSALMVCCLASRVKCFAPRVFYFLSRVKCFAPRGFCFFSRVNAFAPRVFYFLSRVNAFASRVFHSVPRISPCITGKNFKLTYSAVCEDIVDGQVCVDRLVYGGVLLHCVHKHFHKAVNDHIVDLIDNAVSMLSKLVCKRR